MSGLLRAGLQVCRRHAPAEATKRAALALLGGFDGIRDCRFARPELDRISTDGRTARFERLVETTKVLVAGQVHDRPGEAPVFGLLYDMNVVFERFVGRILQRSLSTSTRTVRLQVRDRFLLWRGQQRRFRRVPDIGVTDRGIVTHLVDTKWKRLQPDRGDYGVSQADMYQTYAYGREYGSPLVALLYPHTGGLEPRLAAFRHHPGDEGSPRIEVWTVDVSAAPRPPAGSVAEQLRERLDTPHW